MEAEEFARHLFTRIAGRLEARGREIDRLLAIPPWQFWRSIPALIASGRLLREQRIELDLYEDILDTLNPRRERPNLLTAGETESVGQWY